MRKKHNSKSNLKKHQNSNLKHEKTLPHIFGCLDLGDLVFIFKIRFACVSVPFYFVIILLYVVDFG